MHKTLPAARRPHALIVEDNLLIALGLQEALSSELAYEVAIVSTGGAEAVRTIAETQPDLVVSDLSILLQDGLSPMDLVSTGHSLVIITGDADAAEAYSAVDYEILQKPFSFDQLIRGAERAIRNRREGSPQ